MAPLNIGFASVVQPADVTALVAEGSFPGTITREQVLLTTVRDLYRSQQGDECD
jgi:hypothetical protein